MTYLVTGDAVEFGRRPRMTCVRHRGGWCALKPGTKLDKTATSDATACGHFVTMRFESARRYPDCVDCRKALGLKVRS